MAARVLACASCHGEMGEGTNDDYFPRLAGKPAGYLYNQLVAFRDGRRKYPPMNYLLEYPARSLSQGDGGLFRRAAAAASRPRPRPTSAPTMLARGETLVDQGRLPRGTSPPARAATGRPSPAWSPAIPGLLGLRATYISAQLGAWRYGTRTAAAPDCMQIVAGHLTEDDVKAVAAWLSSRPAPANPSPAAAGLIADAAACGSEPN